MVADGTDGSRSSDRPTCIPIKQTKHPFKRQPCTNGLSVSLITSSTTTTTASFTTHRTKRQPKVPLGDYTRKQHLFRYHTPWSMFIIKPYRNRSLTPASSGASGGTMPYYGSPVHAGIRLLSSSITGGRRLASSLHTIGSGNEWAQRNS